MIENKTPNNFIQKSAFGTLGKLRRSFPRSFAFLPLIPTNIYANFQNKEFIYRGLDWEKIATFTQRISAEFPASQLLSSNTPPDERTRESDSQFLQICCVKPMSNLRLSESPTFKQFDPMDGYEVPEKIKKFPLNNDIQHFQYDRPFHKGPRDKDNEFKV